MESIYHDYLYIRQYLVAGAKRAWVFFHGFPGPGAELKDPTHERMGERFARFVNEHGDDLFFPHYRGIKPSKGDFSILQSIKDGLWFMEFLQTKRYQEVCIIGHSWGGMVAVNVLNQMPEIKINYLILQTPLAMIPDPEASASIIDENREIYPDILGKQPRELILQEMDQLRISYNPINLASKIAPNNTIVVAGKTDNVTPLPMVEAFAKKMISPCQFLTYDEGHNFANRDLLFTDLHQIIFTQ